jgi:hypothetical protein
MSELTVKLVELAEKQARTVLVDMQHSLMPTWVLIDAKNRISVIGTPWQNDMEKEFYGKSLRQEMRKRKVVAYSFVTEAWKATVPPDADLTKVRASERPDKQEVVMALASDGQDQEWRTWEIKRDWHERVTDLVLLPEMPGTPEGWMCEMLKRLPSG